MFYVGKFHYIVMPSRLKDAGATYQQAMAAIFHDRYIIV